MEKEREEQLIQESLDWEEEEHEEAEKKPLLRVIHTYFTKEDLATQILEHQPLYYDESKMWWAWDKENFKWTITDETNILNYVRLLSIGNTIKPNERNEILEALKQEARRRKPKKIEPTWIQFKNKIYDVVDGTNYEATHEYFVTNPIPWEVSGDPRTPVMDRIFVEWVGADYAKTLKQQLAYSLIPDYPIHRLFCHIGGGMNGKSKFLELLTKFIGKENVCTTELDTLMNSRFEVTRLHKKLVCIMGETNFNEMNRTSMLKKLTGGDLIGFEYKNKNPFHDINYAKIFIATNNLPTTSDKTIGFYRRWSIVDWPNQFSEKFDILATIPEEEYNNLATSSIITLNNLLKERAFHKEGSIEERMTKFEEKADFLGKFLDDFTIKAVNEHITKAEFYRKFKEWCKENRHRELAENSLGRKMKAKGYEQSRKHFNWLHDGKGGLIQVWLDIKWKE